MNRKLSCLVLIILIFNIILSLYLLSSRNATNATDNFIAKRKNEITDSKDYGNFSLMLVDSDGNISTNKVKLGEVAIVNKTNYFTQPQVFDVLDDGARGAGGRGQAVAPGARAAQRPLPLALRLMHPPGVWPLTRALAHVLAPGPVKKRDESVFTAP